jgi:hypothetical protein
MKKYIFMTSCPKLSGKAKEYGRNYRKMAILELEEGFGEIPKMISKRAKGVKRIVECEIHHVGMTERSYGRRRMEEMKEEVERLNS